MMKTVKTILALLLAFIMALPAALPAFAEGEGDAAHDISKLVAFFELTDDDGVKNGEKLFPLYDPEDISTWVGQAEIFPGQFVDSVRWKENGRLLGLVMTNRGLVGALDLSGCDEMEFLYCENNEITLLILNGCSSVHSVFAGDNNIQQVFLAGTDGLALGLDLHSNLLTNIDLSSVPRELSVLDVSDNRLTEIDISSLLDIEIFDCSHNRLTSLTVVQSMSTLYCNDNRLTELNMEADWIDELNCSNNNLSSLDLTSLSHLGTLHCDGCPLMEMHLNLLGEPIDLLSDGHGTIGFSYLPDWEWDPELGTLLDHAILYAHPDFGWQLDAWYDADGNWVYFYEESDIIDDLPAALDLTAVFEPMETEVPEGYDGHDYTRLLYFLERRNGNGIKNGEVLNAGYDPADPETWTGTEWTGSPKKLKSAEFHASEDGELAGALDLSDCTELVSLNCGWSGVTSVSVSDCVKLASLTVSGNSELDSISVAGCSLITELDADGCDISDIDLSGCPRLSVLDLENNSLTELDLTGCPLLTELNAGWNSLESIDLSACGMLTSLSLIRTSLSSLDVSACAALTTLNLTGNLLEELDLSHNTALKYLDCKNNRLTGLDLTQCTRLEYVECTGNPLRSIIAAGPGGGWTITVRADGRGTVGMQLHIRSFQGYFEAVPGEGAEFLGWYEDGGSFISDELVLSSQYLDARHLVALFDAPIIPGDANMDGRVDIADALVALRCAMGLIELNDREREAADINGDGEVTLSDALLILRTAMGIV